MKNKIVIAACLSLLVVSSCSKQAAPVAPVSADESGTAAAADGTTLKIGAPTLSAPAEGFQGPLGSSDPITLVLNNVNGAYAAFTVTYEFEVRNPNGIVVHNPKVLAGSGQSVASATATATLIQSSSLAADTVYSWRARATYGASLGPWSATRTFRTAIPTGCFGTTILDPLTNGTTCGKTVGGRFVQGQGWQALALTNGLDYDIPTLANGTVEFDVTNVGPKEGECCNADLKLLSMGDSNAFGSFGSFRDHPYKMHLVQRADSDGLEIIWRNGGTEPDGNPGDHRVKMPCCGPQFSSSNVLHFKLVWSQASGYKISAGVNGGPMEEYMADGFGNIPYAPPNHRISLGCYPRGETIVGSIFRNFRLTPNK